MQGSGYWVRAFCGAAAVLCLGWGARGQTIIYVNGAAPAPGDGATWATAHAFLAEALTNAAGKADLGETVEVWIAAGTYLPDQTGVTPAGGLDDDATFTMHNGVGIYGGFEGSETALEQRDPAGHPVVLHGFLRADFFGTLHVVTALNVDSSAVLDGVIVTNARVLGVRGKGLSLTNSGVRIMGCIVKQLNAQGGASGAGAYCSGGRPVFEDCQFLLNVATAPNGYGGAIYAPGTDLEIRRCLFEGNKADGGGGAVYGGGPATIVEDCSFIANSAERDGSGGAMYLAPGAVVRRCVFLHGTSYYPAAGVYGGGRIEDCVFIQNTTGGGGSYGPTAASGAAEYIGCVFDSNGQPVGSGYAALGLVAGSRAVNCTFYNNAQADIMVMQSASATIDNCILYKQAGATPTEPSHIRLLSAASVTVSNSYFQGLGALYHGSGNIGGSAFLTARFVDPAGPDGVPGTPDDDLRLRAGSPCIDAGDTTAVPPGVILDAAGSARFVDDPGMPDAGVGPAPVVDMGAYEFAGTSCIADFNDDGFMDGIDYDLFNLLFETGDSAADLDRDGFVDGVDNDLFMAVFDRGC